MTTTSRYHCNLCRNWIKPTNGAAYEGFGLHFNHYTGTDNISCWSFAPASDCENHICLACATAIHDELRKAMPAKTKEAAGADQRK